MAGFSWNPQRHTFKIQGDHPPRGTEPVNMAFDGTSIYTQVRFHGQAVNFSLDTGAQKTVLYPGFDKVFPAVRSSATSETHTLTGVGGSSEVGSLFLSSLTFNVGQKDVVLRPAHLLLKNNNSTSSWFAGNLGMDLLNQSRMVKVDFNRMSLTLR